MSEVRTWNEDYWHPSPALQVKKKELPPMNIPALPEFYITFNRGSNTHEVWQRPDLSTRSEKRDVLLSSFDTREEALAEYNRVKNRAIALREEAEHSRKEKEKLHDKYDTTGIRKSKAEAAREKGKKKEVQKFRR